MYSRCFPLEACKLMKCGHKNALAKNELLKMDIAFRSNYWLTVRRSKNDSF